MKESIGITVLDHRAEMSRWSQKELTIEYKEDRLIFILDGERIFSSSWTKDLKPAFKRALELWQIYIDISHR